MRDIPGFEQFRVVEPLHKGWSTDEKFYIVTHSGARLLLRLSDSAQYERKRAEFEMIGRVAALNVPMSQPMDFGRCCEGARVYQLLTWCDGADAEQALPGLPIKQQYALGLEAGRILRVIHSIPAPLGQEDWGSRFTRKAQSKIQQYRACELQFGGGEAFVSYLEHNFALLGGREQSYQHGDYHVGNMILSPDGVLFIIDWNRDDYGDPWEEFNRIVWSAQASPHFAAGQIDGYFEGSPPEKFFQLLCFYIASNTLSSLPWAIPFGPSEVDTMRNQAAQILHWFDGMRRVVPTWYGAGRR